MSKKNDDYVNDIQGLANLVNYAEEYPQGVTKIGYHYYNVDALIKALQDIRIRASVEGTTKADRLLMQILAGLM